MKLSTNMAVDDVAACQQYYTQVLGLEKGDCHTQEGTPIWATVKVGDGQIMFSERTMVEKYMGRPSVGPGHDPSPNMNLYIFKEGVTELDTLQQDLKDKNVEIVRAPEKQFYGVLEMTVKDLNGYYVVFACPAPE